MKRYARGLFCCIFLLAGTLPAPANIGEHLSPEEDRAVRAAFATAPESPDRAIRELRAALGRPLSAPAAYFLADLYRQAHRREEAIAVLRESLTPEPSFPEVRLLLAHLLLAGDRPGEALELLLPLRSDPAAPIQAWTLSAHAWLALDLTLETESAARHILLRTDDPATSANARILLLHALSRRDRNEEAAALCADMLRVSSADAELWPMRVQLLNRANRPEKALAALEAARAMNLADIDTLLLGVQLTSERRDYDQAATLLGEAFQIDPEKAAPAASDLLAWLLQSEAPHAVGALSEALLSLPGEIRGRAPVREALLHVQAAQAWNEDNSEAAFSLYREILDLAPLDALALLRLGDIHRRRNQIDEAALSYERVSRMDGFESTAFLRLAALYANAERFHEAAHAADEALRFDPRESIRAYRDDLRNAARKGGRSVNADSFLQESG